MGFKTIERTDIGAFEIRKEIEIDAPIEIAFEAVLDESGPDAQSPDGSGKSLSMKFEAWPGGRWYRRPGQQHGSSVGTRAGDQAADAAGDHRADADVVSGDESCAVSAQGRGRKDAAHVHASGAGADHAGASRNGMPEGWEQLARARFGSMRSRRRRSRATQFLERQRWLVTRLRRGCSPSSSRN